LPEEPGNVLADPVQIHQVLMNLCTNAHHAMRERGGVLKVRLSSVHFHEEGTTAHPDLTAGRYVKLTVSDTGHGMDQEILPRIFDPYFTTKEKGVGTGLGLAVVHGIVRDHGGAITVQSELGKGSTFDIYFPLIQAEALADRAAEDEAPVGCGRILFVDDEQVLVDIAKQVLESLGYLVETRTSSTEALELFKRQPYRYDIVISDLTMPNLTGEKLARELIRIRHDIPVILCSGYSEAMSKEEAKNIGIKAFVMKPFVRAEIAKKIKGVLEGKQSVG
jgi:two-component system cell cycle sensor histidine kinase/response regulator CckA